MLHLCNESSSVEDWFRVWSSDLVSISNARLCIVSVPGSSGNEAL